MCNIIMCNDSADLLLFIFLVGTLLQCLPGSFLLTCNEAEALKIIFTVMNMGICITAQTLLI